MYIGLYRDNGKANGNYRDYKNFERAVCLKVVARLLAAYVLMSLVFGVCA